MQTPLSGKRVLITGGRGYLAANVMRLLATAGCHVTRLDRTPGAIGSDAAPDIRRLYADIREADVWERALEGIDIVYHFAAQTSVYVAWQDPMEDIKANVLPMLRLLEVCRRKAWKPIILFSGSATEIGLTSDWPVDESVNDDPVTIYDLHKLSAEKYLKHYIREGLVRGAILRLANVYGPGPKSSSADRGVLNLMMRKAIRGEPLTIYGTGHYMRDYVFVEDVAEAFVQAAIHIEKTNGGHFLLGSGQGHTLAAAINLVAERAGLKTGRRVPVQYVEPPSGLSPIESRNFVANITRFASATGWLPQVKLSEGIDRTLEYFLSQEKVTA